MAIEYLEILFGADLDGGTPWRHALAKDASRAGWLPCGPLGLVERLGLVLGLPVSPAPRPLRVAAYGARLRMCRDTARTWSTSWERDPVGVAGYLLGLRDRLRMAGWDGAPVPDGGARLADLADLETVSGPPLPPGLPDALLALRRAVEARDALPLPLLVHVAERPADLDPAVRHLLEALEARGARVMAAAEPLPAARPDTDLAALQRALLADEPTRARLRGDGTVVALEAETPADAAELLAAWQRDHAADRTTVVAATEAVALAAGFQRQGQPSPGATSRSRWRPALQVLPLRLALAFRPVDPLVAAELLSLPVAPLPRGVRRRLLRALGDAPGVGGPAWREAVDRCVEEVDDPSDARRLRESIDAWFDGPTWDPDPGIPPAEAGALCERVTRWARGRAALSEEPEPQLLHAAAVAADLQRMLRREPQDVLVTRPRLEQLHDEAVGAGLGFTVSGAEAGRPAVVGTPGAVLPGAERVVWWGFVDGATADPGPEPWTGPEHRALRAAGLEVPGPGDRRRREAAAWRRPFLLAEAGLVLVRWRLDGRSPTLPHPFSDELEARLAPDALEACRVRAEDAVGPAGARLDGVAWRPEAEEVEPTRAVAPRAVWRVAPEHLAPPERLSPTAVETLFGCPLKWVLSRQARLRPGAVASIAEGDRLVGLFAHVLLQDLVVGPDALDPEKATPEEAAARAGDAFDARVAGEAAPLLRPGHEVERERARASVASAAAALVEMLQRGGWRAVAAEHEASGTFEGLPWGGFVDLLLERADGSPAVLDLKLGNSAYRRDELAEGRALQLAFYADGVANGHGKPPVAYMTVGDGRFLTTDGGAFPGSTAVDGPTMGETLVLARRAWRWWRGVLERGLVPARHEKLEGWEEACEGEAGEPPPAEGPGARKAPCIFCDFETLCITRLGEER